MTYEIRLSVLSPVAEGQKLEMPSKYSFSLAKRLDTLENKTIYLVDTGFGGSAQFMVQLQKWFAKNMPSVKTVRKRKSGHVFMEDESSRILWDEIKEKGDAVVLGVAG
ncbi:MAG: hypothetical protein GX197_06445 [Firmicutes bacterium]|nr:hypothetical protein [Bacillota bacterium]